MHVAFKCHFPFPFTQCLSLGKRWGRATGVHQEYTPSVHQEYTQESTRRSAPQECTPGQHSGVHLGRTLLHVQANSLNPSFSSHFLDKVQLFIRSKWSTYCFVSFVVNPLISTEMAPEGATVPERNEVTRIRCRPKFHVNQSAE